MTPASSSFENLFPLSTSGTLNPPLVTAAPLNNGLFKGDYSSIPTIRERLVLCVQVNGPS